MCCHITWSYYSYIFCFWTRYTYISVITKLWNLVFWKGKSGGSERRSDREIWHHGLKLRTQALGYYMLLWSHCAHTVKLYNCQACNLSLKIVIQLQPLFVVVCLRIGWKTVVFVLLVGVFEGVLMISYFVALLNQGEGHHSFAGQPEVFTPFPVPQEQKSPKLPLWFFEPRLCAWIVDSFFYSDRTKDVANFRHKCLWLATDGQAERQTVILHEYSEKCP